MSRTTKAREANTNVRAPYDPDTPPCGDLVPFTPCTRPGAMDAYRKPSLVNGVREEYKGICSFGSNVKHNEVLYGIYGFDVTKVSALANKAH